MFHIRILNNAVSGFVAPLWLSLVTLARKALSAMNTYGVTTHKLCKQEYALHV